MLERFSVSPCTWKMEGDNILIVVVIVVFNAHFTLDYPKSSTEYQVPCTSFDVFLGETTFRPPCVLHSHYTTVQ